MGFPLGGSPPEQSSEATVLGCRGSASRVREINSLSPGKLLQRLSICVKAFPEGFSIPLVQIWKSGNQIACIRPCINGLDQACSSRILSQILTGVGECSSRPFVFAQDMVMCLLLPSEWQMAPKEFDGIELIAGRMGAN